VSTGPSAVALHELDEHASGTLGVQKGHEMSARSTARLFVDEPEAFRAQAGQVRPQVVGTIGDMVETGAPAGQKPADGGIGCEGLQELYGPRERDADALGVQGFGLGTLIAGNAFVEPASIIQRTNGDRHVIDGAFVREEIIHEHPALWSVGWTPGQGMVGSPGERDKENPDG